MKRFIFFTILGLAFSHFALAAIQRDAINNDSTGYTTASSFTFSCTVSTTANNMIFVNAYLGASTTASATYAGAAITQLRVNSYASPQSGQYDYLWYKYGAATGANNVVISYGGSIGSYAMCASYVGVAQQAPEASTSTTALSTQMTATTTSLSANDWSTMPIRTAGVSTFSAQNASTSIWSADTANGGGWVDSGTAILTPSQNVLGITYTSTANWNGGLMATFAPYVAPSAPAPVLRRANGQKSRL